MRRIHKADGYGNRQAFFPALIAAGLLSSGIGACHAPGPSAQVPAGEQMSTLDTVGEVRRDPTTHTVTYATADDLAAELDSDSTYREHKNRRDHAAMALRFLEVYRNDFRIEDPAHEFEVVHSSPDRLDYHRVRLNQVLRGVPVADAELSFQFGPDTALSLVQGRYIPTPSIDFGQAKLSPEQVVEQVSEALGEGLEVSSPKTVIFPTKNGDGVLAYELDATRGLAAGWRVTIDSHSGALLAKEATRYPTQPE